MEIKEGKIKIIIPDGNYPEHTLLFLAMFARMINKGLSNPAHQLHSLCVIHTGKTFGELLHRNDPVLTPENLIEMLKLIPKEVLRKTMESLKGKMNLTDTTIDDILRGNNE